MASERDSCCHGAFIAHLHSSPHCVAALEALPPQVAQRWGQLGLQGKYLGDILRDLHAPWCSQICGVPACLPGLALSCTLHLLRYGVQGRTHSARQACTGGPEQQLVALTAPAHAVQSILTLERAPGRAWSAGPASAAGGASGSSCGPGGSGGAPQTHLRAPRSCPPATISCDLTTSASGRLGQHGRCSHARQERPPALQQQAVPDSAATWQARQLRHVQVRQAGGRDRQPGCAVTSSSKSSQHARTSAGWERAHSTTSGSPVSLPSTHTGR